MSEKGLQMTDKTQIAKFNAPAASVGEMKFAMDKLMKRAAKKGIPAPEFSISEPFEVKKVKENAWGEKKTIIEHLVTVTVNAAKLKLDGYDFIGSYEYHKEGNIVAAAPGKTMGVEFRTMDCHCDHCHTNRYRGTLYVFEKDGQQFQVGKNCLRDFMGHDPKSLLEWAAFPAEVSQGDEDSWGFSNKYYISLVEFAAAVQAVMKYEGGYVSMAAAQSNGVTATVHLTSTYLFAWSKEQLEYRALVNSKLTAEDKATFWDNAEKAVKWAAEEWTATSDFAWNLKVIAKQGAMTSHKQYGIGASLWPTYEREMGRLKEIEFKKKQEAEAAKASNWVGKEGDRIRDVEAVVTADFFVKSGDWGDTYLYKFLSTDGNVFTWFSSPRGLRKGDKVKLTGTVKKLSDYKGIKETQLTRCKVETKEGVVS